MPKEKSALAEPNIERKRRLPAGAEVIPGRGVHFRVWAPRRKRVEVVFERGPDGKTGKNSEFELTRDG